MSLITLSCFCNFVLTSSMHRWIKVVKHTGHQNHYLLQQQFKRSTQDSLQSLVILIWYAPEPVLTLIRPLTNPIRSVMLLIFKISISDSHIGIWSNHGSKSVSVNPASVNSVIAIFQMPYWYLLVH